MIRLQVCFNFYCLMTICLVYGLPINTEHESIGKSTNPDERNSPRVQLMEGDIFVAAEGRNVIKKPRLKWINQTVPYIIASTYGPRKVAIIKRAFNAISAKTCIKFVSRTNEEDYIKIISDDGCYSSVGRRGGRQILSLEDPDCVDKGTVIHELLHTLGIWHEQSRYDRDQYVDIIFDNVQPGQKIQFNKEPRRRSQTFGLPYDYSSIMHYSQYAFSIDDNKPTIVTKPPGIPIGITNSMSRIDIAKICLLYEC